MGGRYAMCVRALHLSPLLLFLDFSLFSATPTFHPRLSWVMKLLLDAGSLVKSFHGRAITSICEKSRHGRSKLPDRDHPGVSGPCPHPHAAAQQPRGCGFVISFILRTILRARAELAPSPTPRLRRVVTRLHRGPRRWFLAVRSCRSPRRFDRAISRFI